MEQKVISQENLEKVIRTYISRKVSADDLNVPILPHVAQRVMGIINDPNIAVQDIGKIVNKDQELTARIVRVANSPVYSRGFEIKSVKKAVLTIGMKALYDIVFSIAMGEKVFRSKLFAKRMKYLWEHSLAVGYISKYLAKMKNLNAGYAFLCGMLHDIGKPLLLVTLEEFYNKHNGQVIYSNEMVDEILMDFHQDVGALMGTAWKFPTL